MNMPHPQSYGMSVPYAPVLLRLGQDPTLARRILEAGGAEAGTELDRTRAIAQVLTTSGMDRLPNVPGGVAGHNWIMGQFTMAQVYTMFCSSGRIIYDFDPRLTSVGKDGKFIGLLLVPVRHHGWPDFGDIGVSGDIETTLGAASQSGTESSAPFASVFIRANRV